MHAGLETYLVCKVLDIAHSLLNSVYRVFLLQFEVAFIVMDTNNYL